MDSDRQYLLSNLFEVAKEKILASPQDYVWTEGEIGFAIFSMYSGPERNEPTEQECRKMALAILKLKPAGLNLRTKSEDDDGDEAEASESSKISADRIDTDGEPDNYVQDSEYSDYATNWDGTVICLGGARKKKGKRMRPYAGWAKAASGKFYPTCYFRLTKDGNRVIQTPAQMLMRRFKTLSPPKPKRTEEIEEAV